MKVKTVTDCTCRCFNSHSELVDSMSELLREIKGGHCDDGIDDVISWLKSEISNHTESNETLPEEGEGYYRCDKCTATFRPADPDDDSSRSDLCPDCVAAAEDADDDAPMSLGEVNPDGDDDDR